MCMVLKKMEILIAFQIHTHTHDSLLVTTHYLKALQKNNAVNLSRVNLHTFYPLPLHLPVVRRHFSSYIRELKDLHSDGVIKRFPLKLYI